MIQNNIAKILEGHKFVPVVTFKDVGEVDPFIAYLQRMGVKCIEITLRTEAAMECIKKVKASHKEILLGVGTVQTDAQVQALKRIGVDFLVSPGSPEGLLSSMEQSGIGYLPGVATPTEVMRNLENGVEVMKFFPANLYGGKDALIAYAQLFPKAQFCPTGGISRESSEGYLALPNVFAVGGSWFQKEFISNN